jgi:hemerythrin-like domain-containing protein
MLTIAGMTTKVLVSRRALMVLTLGGAAPAVAGAKPAPKRKQKENDNEIGPGEDLMREHGVLRRALLVYGEASRRLESGAEFDLGALQKCARLVRNFVEDYHEKQEEEVLFPRFERAHKLVELVSVLRAQHQAGRRSTDRIQGLATAGVFKDGERRRQLRAELAAFVRMYEPHAAREDTVLFPALHDIVTGSEYDALGEEFERREHKQFGEDGFERAVAEIDAIEKSLGIEDLALFTSRSNP